MKSWDRIHPLNHCLLTRSYESTLICYGEMSRYDHGRLTKFPITAAIGSKRDYAFGQRGPRRRVPCMLVCYGNIRWPKPRSPNITAIRSTCRTKTRTRWRAMPPTSCFGPISYFTEVIQKVIHVGTRVNQD